MSNIFDQYNYLLENKEEEAEVKKEISEKTINEKTRIHKDIFDPYYYLSDKEEISENKEEEKESETIGEDIILGPYSELLV